MEAAKRHVAEFTAKRGHFTDVEEVVAPAVTREVVQPTRHEIITKAVDREVHQHHYHTTVQPLSHTERLPEKHVHNLIPVERKALDVHRERNTATKAAVAAELGLFKNTSTTLPVQTTRSQLPAVIGERVYHHIHEVVQPLIYKETIQREVVHTTVPVHEVHHNTPVHHTLSELPVKAAAEWNKMSSTLNGNKRTSQYEGPPREYRHDLESTVEKLSLNKPAPLKTNTNTTTTTTTNVILNKRHTGTGLATPPLSPTMGGANSASSSPSLPATPRNNRLSEDLRLRTSNDGVPANTYNNNVGYDSSPISKSDQHNQGFLHKMMSRGRGNSGSRHANNTAAY